MPLQRHARLARRVVEHHLAVGAAAALAAGHGLRLNARQHRRMRMRTAVTGEPGRRVAGRRAGTLADLVMLGVALSPAVVDAADHYRPVDIAVNEIDQHFATDARYRHRAPV